MTTTQIPTIELFPHNQETYNNIIDIWKTSNKVATIQATGTGKTFLILKCMTDFWDKNKVVLAPSNYILEQLQKKGNNKLYKTELLTYSKLSLMDEEEIDQLNPNLIVLDEFHRCGAETWGKGVRTLLEMFPNAKILGTSATPIRYTDNERDMSDELFEGNIAVNLSLAEAIVKGILPMPKYISALYTFDGELENLQSKIENSHNNDEEKKELLKEVEVLRRKLNRSKGIPQILKKHLTNKGGKFIVFCKDREHLNEMQDQVVEWFKKANIGKKIESYKVVSGELTNNTELKGFVENENEENVRLLFSIDMLNEGIHIEDITGVMFLRPTISPNVYYQQIGRALQVNGNKEPLVFDFVNNYSNIGQYKPFIKELREGFEKENRERRDNREDEVEFDFSLIDKIQDVINMFDDIINRLLNSWDNHLNLLVDYKNKFGNCLVPIRYIVDGLKLGLWVQVQRKLYSKRELLHNRIEKLESVGFVWDVHDLNWNESYNYLLEFKKQFGNYSVPKNYEVNGIKLGNWINHQRKQYKNGKLSKEKEELLNEIDFKWSVLDLDWNNLFSELVKYKEKYGNCLVPRDYNSNETTLGSWVRNQRFLYRKGKLSKDRIDNLESLSFYWGRERTTRNSNEYKEKIETKEKLSRENLWEECYNALIEYKEHHGNCLVSRNYKIDNINLGVWVNKQRIRMREGKLNEVRVNKLNNIGFIWDATFNLPENLKTKSKMINDNKR